MQNFNHLSPCQGVLQHILQLGAKKEAVENAEKENKVLISGEILILLIHISSLVFL